MSVLDTAKQVVELVQKADNIELYRKILDLQAELLKLVDDNGALRDQVKALREQLVLKANLRFRGNRYWSVREDGKEEGPFCPTCWDIDQRLVRNLATDTMVFCYYCANHRSPKK
jgi:ClpP class serine protease